MGNMRSNTLLFTLVLIAGSCGPRIEHARSVEVLINGNCGMCEETIEASAYEKGVSVVDWDRKTRLATITFDSSRTNVHVLLKRIANAGYDNQEFETTDEAYNNRPQCCRYRRTGKAIQPPTKADARHGH